MSEINEILAYHRKVDEVYKRLRETHSMNEVADLIESLDEDMAKWVLKKFVYSK
jgi:UDP:flavonoid glycosyltransferase YjiC (YdhE family)